MTQYNKEIKNAVYIRIIEGQSIKEISGDMKISQSTLRRWKKDLKNNMLTRILAIILKNFL